MLAMELSEEDQVTGIDSLGQEAGTVRTPLSYLRVAVNCCVSPLFIVALSGEMLIRLSAPVPTRTGIEAQSYWAVLAQVVDFRAELQYTEQRPTDWAIHLQREGRVEL